MHCFGGRSLNIITPRVLGLSQCVRETRPEGATALRNDDSLTVATNALCMLACVCLCKPAQLLKNI